MYCKFNSYISTSSMRLLMLGSHTVDFDKRILNTLSEFPTSSSFVRWIAVDDKLFLDLDGLLLPACPAIVANYDRSWMWTGRLWWISSAYAPFNWPLGGLQSIQGCGMTAIRAIEPILDIHLSRFALPNTFRKNIVSLRATTES